MNMENGALSAEPKRNTKGQWEPGKSGCGNGRRGNKKSPKSFDEQVMATLLKLLASIERDLPRMKPGDKIAAGRLLEKFGAVDLIRKATETTTPYLTAAQARERLNLRIEEIRNRRRGDSNETISRPDEPPEISRSTD